MSRCLFHEGKAVLVAHDENGKFIIGVTKHPKDVVRWLRSGVTAADRREMQAEAQNHVDRCKEQQWEEQQQ